MAVPVDLIRQLYRQRLRLRLSQRGLAMRVGVDKTSLQRWEGRKMEPTLGGFCAWAEELGYDIALVPAPTSVPRPSRVLADGFLQDRF